MSDQGAMANFNQISNLKTTLLAPIIAPTKPSKSLKHLSQPLIQPPPTNSINLATRHDHHNIEIKTVSEISDQASIVETDIFLFFPRTFEILAIGKSELAKDFRCRMRLATPSCANSSAAAFETSLRDLRVSIFNFLGNSSLGDELTEATKDTCAIIGEALKHSAVEQTRQLLLSHKLGNSEEICIHGLDTLSSRIGIIRDMMSRIRETIDRPDLRSVTVLTLFDEYLSQTYVRFLGTIRGEFATIGIPNSGSLSLSYRNKRLELENFLDQLQENEARHRRRFNVNRTGQESDIEREHRLVRLSQLKKFFQSRSFVEVSRQQAAKRISESTAAAGTAIAGIVATLLERFARPDIINVAFHGLFVLSFGVIVYVLRDRMKDYAKKIFHEKAAKLLPDFEQQLLAKDRKIGTAKEWYRIVTAKNVDPQILAARNTASEAEMEYRLPEDIFHFRKVQELNGSNLSDRGDGTAKRALHENTRINIERHLKHMDDPFKEFTDLDPSGRFTKSRSHRVYHFYLCVKTTSYLSDPSKLGLFRSKSQPIQEQMSIYRIVLDKNGVDRLDCLNSLISLPRPDQTV
jgi:hypothetical protein